MKYGDWIFCTLLCLGSFANADDDLLNKKGGGSGSSSGGSNGSGGGGSSDPPSNREPRRNSEDSRDRDRDRRNGDDLFNKRRETGRTGRADYRTNHNSSGRDRGRIPDLPPADPQSGTLAHQVTREDNVRRHSGSSGNWRQGYYSHDRRWNDDYFCYPHYGFNYDQRHYTLSPWYYYTNLPPYIRSSRLQFGGSWIEINFNNACDWRRPGRGDRRPSRPDANLDLNWAIDDLIRAFENNDRRALDRLILRNSWIRVRFENGLRYLMRSDDFYDTFLDLVLNTRTNSFRVEDVCSDNRGAIQVTASHEFSDGWRNRQILYHRYILEPNWWSATGRSGYSITEFDLAAFGVGRRARR